MNQRLIGQLIGNRYRLTYHVSEGGYGNVFKAVDTQLDDELVAVKLLRPPPPDMGPEYYQQLQQRFMDEARVSALLGEHPNIVQVRSYGMYQNQPYLVMEYLNAKPYTGQGLDYILTREGPLHPVRVVNLALQICSALHHAHNFQMDLGKHSIRGVIHRDIKPSNIFVQKGPDGKERIKILDFGISKLMGETARGLTQTGYFLGTMVYASPEQMRGEKLDARSDIYSLGLLLYELLTGVLPFEPDTDSLQGWYHVHNFQKPRPFREHKLSHRIPDALEKVIFSCLEKDPALRPPNMEVVSQQLRAVYSDKVASSTAPDRSAPPQSHRPQRIPTGFGQQVTQQPMGRVAPKPQTDEGNLQRAVHLIEEGEYKMAVHLLNEMISLAPNEARYYLYRALAHQRQGHWGLAQMDYQGVLRLEPDNLSAEQGLREVEQQVGQEYFNSKSGSRILNTPRLSKGLALGWLVANFAAAALGYLGVGALIRLLGVLGTAASGLAGAGIGLVIGLLQWVVLRQRVSPWWIGATGLGTALGWVGAEFLAPLLGMDILDWIVVDPLPQRAVLAMSSITRGLLIGIGVGGLQWALLSQHWKGTWAWILATIAEGGLSALLLGWLLSSLGLNSWVVLGMGLLANTRPLSAMMLLNLHRIPAAQRKETHQKNTAP
ncbi:protein kinase domain-containing protein [Thermostichus vulcanus]|uniref:Protein kinase n=1 Tax=Thermostichus vulcanus str. 'Rupite' TaxID=2813851 RepID=A0ABT0CES9_THEVL|nr:protein kinase [Thermostichus vulcanus]MCJ2544276.1 protein kinase [Thermostichus vulcanus str. 'Rupite']